MLRLDNSGLATLLVSQVGFGGTLGFLLGYGLKKVAAIVLKIVALISGLFMLGLTWLASIGVITVNFNSFANAAGNTFANSLTAIVGSLAFLAQVFPMGGSFGLGFYLGAKKG
ncbi:MAG: FUN14 domain-containing protein [Candidatus Bathyarchaeia archaeon]